MLPAKVNDLQVPPDPRVFCKQRLEVGLGLLHSEPHWGQAPTLRKPMDVCVDWECRLPVRKTRLRALVLSGYCTNTIVPIFYIPKRLGDYHRRRLVPHPRQQLQGIDV